MPDDALLAIVNRLTAKQKNRIQRVFIISNLSDVYRDSPRYGFFEEFAALHYPEKLEEIKAIYSAKYDPKQQRAEMELEQFKASKPTEAEEMEANEPEQTEVESEEIPEIVEVPQEDQPQASPTEDAPVVVPEEPQDNPLQPELPEKPVTEPDEKPEPEREDAPDVQLPESDDDCPFIEPYDLIEPENEKIETRPPEPTGSLTYLPITVKGWRNPPFCFCLIFKIIIMKYFGTIMSFADLKRQYRKLAIANHPDKGGSTQAMQEINAEFETLYRIWEKRRDEEPKVANGYEKRL